MEGTFTQGDMEQLLVDDLVGTEEINDEIYRVSGDEGKRWIVTGKKVVEGESMQRIDFEYPGTWSYYSSIHRENGTFLAGGYSHEYSSKASETVEEWGGMLTTSPLYFLWQQVDEGRPPPTYTYIDDQGISRTVGCWTNEIAAALLGEGYFFVEYLGTVELRSFRNTSIMFGQEALPDKPSGFPIPFIPLIPLAVLGLLALLMAGGATVNNGAMQQQNAQRQRRIKRHEQ